MAGSIIIYGGSFNPPTRAHAAIIGHVMAFLPHREIKKLLVVPTYTHAYGKFLADFGDRLAMCELAFSEYTETSGRNGRLVSVSALDRALNSKGSMFRFLCKYQEIYRIHDFNLKVLVGADQALEVYDKWSNGPDIVGHYDFIVVPRGSEVITEDKCPWLNYSRRNHCVLPPLLGDHGQTSSTRARKGLASGSKYAALVDYLDEDIYYFCRKNKLYTSAIKESIR